MQHRYDQSILTALIYLYLQQGNTQIALLPETAESDNTAAVVASRIRVVEKVPLKTKVIRLLKTIIGEKGYALLHRVK